MVRTNRRDFLKLLGLGGLELATGGGLALLQGCAERRDGLLPTSRPLITAGLVEDPTRLIDDPQHYRGRFTTVSHVGNYLTGTLDDSVKSMAFLYRDANNGVVFPHLEDIGHSELAPQILGRRWVVPLVNLLSHGRGPYRLDSVAVRTKDYQKHTEQVDFPIEMRVVDVSPDALPQNAARPYQEANAQTLARTLPILVRYVGSPVALLGTGSNKPGIAPTLIAPLHQYENGVDQNTRVIHRASQLYIHGTQVFGVSPLDSDLPKVAKIKNSELILP